MESVSKLEDTSNRTIVSSAVQPYPLTDFNELSSTIICVWGNYVVSVSGAIYTYIGDISKTPSCLPTPTSKNILSHLNDIDHYFVGNVLFWKM